jgi:hypothetical protein
MKGLSRESRLLIDAARGGDEPTARDMRRVRAGLARKIAVGAAAGVAAATATHAAAGGVAAGTGGAGAATAAGAGVVGGAGAVGGTASVAAGALATGFGAKLVVTVALVGVMGAGTVGYVKHRETAATPRATVSAIAPPAAHARPNAPPVAPRAPVVAPVTGPEPAVASAAPDAPPAPVVTPQPKPKTSVTASTPDGLDAELAFLQDVHGALRDKDGARALRLLDERARRFPNGALGEESEAARVFALCQLGRVSEARDVAGRFLREHPRSPLAQRVARACEDDPSTF